VETPPKGALNLQDVAEVLGVHYQTAYRWVRSGAIPSTVVRGRYVVDPAAVSAFRTKREKAVSSAARPSRRKLDRHADRMYDLLLAGDETAARQLATTLVEGGVTVVALIQEVLVPPMRRIGAEWRRGKLSIWEEHRASAIVERVLGAVHPTPRGRRRGTAVVVALSGDHHDLPTAMAAAALRDDNWHVHHLGSDVPAKEVVSFVAAHPDVDLVVLTVTNPDVADDATKLAAKLERAEVTTIVGAPGRTLQDLVTSARGAP
jgi:MerR family transcriptional regulator, light-induced transcriptional regulator